MLKSTFQFLALFFIVTLFLVGCSKDNNPVSENDTDHNHAEAVGFVITSSGVEVVRYQEGQVTGSIQVVVAEMTALLTISFIAEDGDFFQPNDDDYKLDWQVSDTGIADVHQHEEDGKWRFHIEGVSAGATTIVFKILHGDHADFVAQAIPVEVTKP